MVISSREFVIEIQQMVRAKHSKDHPIIGMIEDGMLDRAQLKGFIGQFYLFFPKPFPKPIAAMLRRYKHGHYSRLLSHVPCIAARRCGRRIR